MIEQRAVGAPLGSIWNPGPADSAGYVRPDRSRPALDNNKRVHATVTVFGTVRNERKALARSLSVWLRQKLPDGVSVEFLVLDDGSSDGVESMVGDLIAAGAPIRYTRWREPDDPTWREIADVTIPARFRCGATSAARCPNEPGTRSNHWATTSGESINRSAALNTTVHDRSVGSSGSRQRV